jgi:hypothetical protein
MRQRERRYSTKPGTVSKLCPCGVIITTSQVLCYLCWPKAPENMRQRYLKARARGGELAGPAADAIREYVRGGVA